MSVRNGPLDDEFATMREEIFAALHGNECEGYFWNGEYVLFSSLLDRISALELKHSGTVLGTTEGKERE